MGWLEDLRGQVIGLDSAPVMYYLEKNPGYLHMLHPFFAMVGRKECSIVTSVMTLLEGLVVPIRNNNDKLIRKYYELLFDTDDIETIAVSPDIAKRAARLRAFYNIKTPDAIHIATAIYAGASAFLTNDKQLSSIPDIKVLVLDKLKKDL